MSAQIIAFPFRLFRITTLVGVVLMICASQYSAMGQHPLTRQPGVMTGPPKPVSLAHLYWHFLMYQNHLDTRAMEEASKGKDVSMMRGYLQKAAGLSDTDFAPIRISSARLSGEIKSLNMQALAIQMASQTPTTQSQLKALALEREADINAEVSYLKGTLPSEKTTALEAFLTKFFSPANAVARPPSTIGVQAPAAVQR